MFHVCCRLQIRHIYLSNMPRSSLQGGETHSGGGGWRRGGGEEGEPHRKPKTQRGDEMKSNTFTTCSQPTVEASTVSSNYSNRQTVSMVTDTDNRKLEDEAGS